jgi:hypothetical protein
MADHGDHGHKHGAPAKTNKPSNNNFRQQRLVAWQPIMSPPHVVACLFLVAIAFAPVGIAVLFANKDAIDVEIGYGRGTGRLCSPTSSDALFTWSPGPGAPGANVSMGCLTQVAFTVTEEMQPPIYMYYKLTNFYQNHRRFAKSRSVGQLIGNDPSDMADCDPLLKPGDITGLTGQKFTLRNTTEMTYGSMKYSPCGLVAWSMFNDSFALYENFTGTPNLICDGAAFYRHNNQPMPGAGNCTKDGITWASDGDKFKMPTLNDNIWTADRTAYGAAPVDTPDPFVRNGWYAGEPGHSLPVITDQDLQVWMRTAALPDFRKLYRVIHRPLVPGKYVMVIREFYPVESFGGEKYFALSTLSWLGGKNEFLGIAYIVVGGLSFVLAIIFFVVYKATGDRMQNAIDSLSELR